jgi:hypothetical protein
LYEPRLAASRRSRHIGLADELGVCEVQVAGEPVHVDG